MWVALPWSRPDTSPEESSSGEGARAPLRSRPQPGIAGTAERPLLGGPKFYGGARGSMARHVSKTDAATLASGPLQPKPRPS